MSGLVGDGETLAPIAQLSHEFGVSRESMRLALKALEAEGLLSIRRGPGGGSVVHLPPETPVEPGPGVYFRIRSLPPDDLLGALREIEPVCAGMCAMRADRDSTVLPRLKSVQLQSEEHMTDSDRWAKLATTFHRELIQGCGNMSVSLILGAVEAACAEHSIVWTREAAIRPDLHRWDKEHRRRGTEEHGIILAYIERGDDEGAIREARRHLQQASLGQPERPDLRIR